MSVGSCQDAIGGTAQSFFVGQPQSGDLARFYGPAESTPHPWPAPNVVNADGSSPPGAAGSWKPAPELDAGARRAEDRRLAAERFERAR